MIAWTIYLTFAGALVALLAPRAFARPIALVTTVAGFVVTLPPSPKPRLRRHLQTIVRVPWVPSLGINYHLAVDGISLTLVLLTGLAAVGGVLFSWNIEHRAKEFFVSTSRSSAACMACS